MDTSIGWLLLLTLLLSAIGGISGWQIFKALWDNGVLGSGIGVLAGALYGVVVGIKELAPYFYGYETVSAAPVVVQAPQAEPEPTFFLFEDKLKGITWRVSRFGVPVAVWIRIAGRIMQFGYKQSVYENDGYFQKRDDARNVYDLASPAFATAGMIERYGPSGYRTTPYGDEKFEQLSKGDWRVIQEIPDDVEIV